MSEYTWDVIKVVGLTLGFWIGYIGIYIILHRLEKKND
jgi:hypothetical protein